MSEYVVWTDGACSGNPGPGGWAAIVVPPDGGDHVELSGGDRQTTNNRMEFSAAIHGLKALPDGAEVLITTDSRLMLDSMTKWLPGWKRKDFKTAAGKPVKNQDLILELERQINRMGKVRWEWVKGHANSALNERADQLAVAACAQQK